MAPNLDPQEPIVPIMIQPPSPPFGGKWAESYIVYAGERLLELDYVEKAISADYKAAQEAWIQDATAADEAWAIRKQQETPITDEERATREASLETFATRQQELNRMALLPIARYLVWKITDSKGVTYVGGPDQLGWATLPTAALLWLVERGKAQARNELDGPLPKS